MDSTSHLPPILSETSKLFVASTKATKYKDNVHCLTARNRPKPELVMHRTKPKVFAPFITQSLNHAQHETLKEVLHAYEVDTTHHCLRPVDRLYWYFELLEQLASQVSPIQALLRQVQKVLCEAVYDSSMLQKPQATRGNEYAVLVHQVEYSHVDSELEQLQAQLKTETTHYKSQTEELESLKKLLQKAKATQDKMEEELAVHADFLQRDEDLYEHLVGDELALDRKASLHRLQLVEAKSMLQAVTQKADAMRDGFRETMCDLHEKEREKKRKEEATQTIKDLQCGAATPSHPACRSSERVEYTKLVDESESMSRDIERLESQLKADQQVVVDKRVNLEEAEAEFAEVSANSADLQRTHTPRPKWDVILRALPEVAYVDPAHQGPPKTAEKARHKKRAPLGRTQAFVKEMCHWLQRIHGDCGMSLQLARLANESEAARLELSTLQAQMEQLTRRQKKQILAIPGGAAAGLPSLATVAKTVAAATKLLGTATAFPSESATLVPSVAAPKDFITALGTTPEVPQFLRHTGRVRNRHMAKTELERIIRTVWSGKKAKETHMGIKIPLEEYLYEVLKTKFGIQTIIAEWGYNILHGLKAFSWDSEVELFFLCLTGAVSEAIHDDQELLLDECRNLLLRLNDTYHDVTLKREPKRVYLNDVMATLHNFFPMKTPLQLKSIERELLRETKLKDKSVQGMAGETLVAIDDLLPTKLKKAHRGYFVKILRTQHFKEIQDYLALLDRKIREADLHGCGRVEINEIKAAMQSIDVTVTDTWLAECISRGIPKRLVGQMDMSSVVEYRVFFKVHQSFPTSLSRYGCLYTWRPLC
ncbi:hypothetical protein, variant 2 [Aphanomyces invadans]|uniref:Translin-associated factor X-interacting protein 1 N-terminal domain-containing protein n=1 Tax=Aphanomyces invadans TaxID=157072 RepID=A0A024UPW2_9STRA|nr:hypothetical protein, variant 2 [Aphanomyces invadans]ETW08339.1 hypothetical protein, variant 2 [Aphanomyces invadans]|eukprot:XP_008862150.1 hypothetical protein, variant 2 [Aphanomyces invadans]